MFNAFRILLLASALVPVYLCHAAGQENYQAGPDKDYEILSTPVPTSTPGKIEVVEAFWYGCPHCFRFEAFLEPWAAKLPNDVALVRIPITFGDESRALHAKMYYTAKQFNKLSTMHQAIFNAMNVERKRFAAESEIADFFATFGIDGKKFAGTFDSFIIDSQVRQGDATAAKYAISGTPSMIINGKYRVMGESQRTIDICNYLIEKERAAMRAAKK